MKALEKEDILRDDIFLWKYQPSLNIRVWTFKTLISGTYQGTAHAVTLVPVAAPQPARFHRCRNGVSEPAVRLSVPVKYDIRLFTTPSNRSYGAL